jgi:hypothetical protein
METDAPAPIDAPEDIAPVIDAPADDITPGDSAPTIQPGQSPTDLDFDAMLEEIDAELDADKPADEEEEQPPADEEEEKPADEEEEKPKEEEEEKPPVEGADLNTVVDIADVEQYFAAQPDPRYGIEPVGEVRNPEPGESAADYFKNVTMPATIQAVKNMTGFAQRNADIESQQGAEQIVARDAAWVNEFDALIKSNAMPAYAKDADGRVDPASEGGKVIGEVMQLMSEHNQKNPDRQITSVDHAFRALYQPAQEKAAAEAAKQAQQQRRSGANSVLNGRPGGATNANAKGPQSIRKGQSVTDIDYESLLG